MKKYLLEARAPRAIALVVAGLFATVPAVHAAGFQLSEQSVTGLGRAYAGAGVVGDDLSAVFYNPAGMSLIQGTQVQGGMTYAAITAPLTTANGATDNGRAKAELVPNGYLVHQLNDRVTLGLGLTVPFGLGSDYSDNWAGRTTGISSSIKTLDINPSVAYKLNDSLSLGLGVSAQYATAKLKKGAAPAGTPGLGTASGEINADSWAYGYNLGVMYSISQDTRLGLSYRSKIRHDAEGDYTFTGAGPGFAMVGGRPVPYDYSSWNGVSNGSAQVITPETLLLSATTRLSDRWSIAGTARWTNWTRFEQLVIKNDSSNPAIGKPTVVDNQWEASWLFSVGADYRYDDRVTLRGGLAYETTPVPDAQHRNPLIPDTDRVWLNLGVSWKLDPKTTIDVAYSYLRGVGDSSIDTPALKGEYKSAGAHLLGVQAQYRF